MGADAAMALLAGLTFGFVIGVAVYRWICEARELRQYHGGK